MYHYPRYSGVTLLYFLDWKFKPKWLEEMTFRHANGFKSRTEPLLHLTRQQALQIARTPRGLQRERPIDRQTATDSDRQRQTARQRGAEREGVKPLMIKDDFATTFPMLLLSNVETVASLHL